MAAMYLALYLMRALAELPRPVLRAATPRQNCSACSVALLPEPFWPEMKLTTGLRQAGSSAGSAAAPLAAGAQSLAQPGTHVKSTFRCSWHMKFSTLTDLTWPALPWPGPGSVCTAAAQSANGSLARLHVLGSSPGRTGV